jgi:hypothetical protein
MEYTIQLDGNNTRCNISKYIILQREQEKVLIVIDQWNAILEHNIHNNHPLFCLRGFRELELTNGFRLYAISSNFRMVKDRDFDLAIYQKLIPSYNQLEIANCMEYHKLHGIFTKFPSRNELIFFHPRSLARYDRNRKN